VPGDVGEPGILVQGEVVGEVDGGGELGPAVDLPNPLGLPGRRSAVMIVEKVLDHGRTY